MDAAATAKGGDKGHRYGGGRPSAAGEDAAGPNTKHGLSAMTTREVVVLVAMQGVVACAVFVGEVNTLAVAVLA